MAQDNVGLASDFYGQDVLFSRWQKCFLQGRLPHSILLSGDSDLENLKMAWVLTQSLLCEKLQATPCGECGNCHRVKTKSSESVLEIKPQKNLIRLEELKDFSQFFNLRGWQDRKVIIIHQAHLLNASAANRLLKSIEEPPENTFFFLTTDSPRQVLATLRSRSQNLPVLFSERRSVENEEVLNHVFSFLNTLVDSKSNFLISKWRDDFRDRNFSKLWVQSAETVVRDLLFCKFENPVINSDRIDEIETLAYKKPIAFWCLLFEKIFTMELGAKQNFDPLLQVERLYIQMRTVTEKIENRMSYGMD